MSNCHHSSACCSWFLAEPQNYIHTETFSPGAFPILVLIFSSICFSPTRNDWFQFCLYWFIFKLLLKAVLIILGWWSYHHSFPFLSNNLALSLREAFPSIPLLFPPSWTSEFIHCHPWWFSPKSIKLFYTDAIRAPCHFRGLSNHLYQKHWINPLWRSHLFKTWVISDIDFYKIPMDSWAGPRHRFQKMDLHFLSNRVLLSSCDVMWPSYS